MAASYYENGMQWVDGDRKAAYRSAKVIAGGFSPMVVDRVDLNSLRRVHCIKQSSIDMAFELVKLMHSFSVPSAKYGVCCAMRSKWTQMSLTQL